VCESGWDVSDASVVCRQQGYSSVGASITRGTVFGSGTASNTLVLQCNGREALISDCPYSFTTCQSSAGVLCQPQTACNQGDIRLVGSTNSLEGRVEMCYDGVWGAVCSDYWETVEASVVCRQLGYSSSGARPKINAAYGQGSSAQPILLDDVRCRGHEHRLIDCSYLAIESHNCGHSQDAGVICLQGCTDGEVRLVNATYSEGRLEICRHDEWGTVCDLMWDSSDAGVVCRQLGLQATGMYF
jgi:deleted-in-malignant-brain-tumors protein 1